jgi:protein-tyrosine-phosphatase
MAVSQPDSVPCFLANFSRRDALAAALAVSLTAGCASLRQRDRPLVLFVCQYGTAKSAIARELLRLRIKERGLAIDAMSRGLTLADHVSPQLKARLKAEGIDPASEAPQVLLPADWERATVIVAFNPLPLAVPRAKIRDWTDLPSINDDYANSRAMLDRRLDTLLDELAAPA